MSKIGGNILAEIVRHKRDEIKQSQSQVPENQLRAMLDAAPKVRDFLQALQASPFEVSLIAEIKKKSPNHPKPFQSDFDPAAIARTYESQGAACISCLTDEKYFGGSLDDLAKVRRAVSIPVLRKDFLINPYQVYEARVAGADCVLLIAECIDDDGLLRDLAQLTSELGMQYLVEVYTEENLHRVLQLDIPLRLLGINSRNLKTMEISLDHIVRLAPKVPASVHLVGESGIYTRADILKLKEAGVRSVLVGSSIMGTDDVNSKIGELLGHQP